MARYARLASVAAVARAVRLAVRPGGPSMGERAGAVPRMVRATLSGDYVGVSKGRLALMLAATGYLIAPIDVLPELFLPVLGLADDALVLSWLATRLVEETEAFLEWEKARTGSPSGGGSAQQPGAPGGSGWAGGGTSWDAGANRPAGSRVVPGDVVH